MEHKLISQDYYQALKENRLLGLKCRDCNAITVPPKLVCRQCTSPELDIIELKGSGKIRTFTTVNVAAEGRENEAPYIIVIVELDDGPWLMGNLEEVEPSQASMSLIGQRVTLEGRVYEGDKYSAGEGVRPLFHPAD